MKDIPNVKLAGFLTGDKLTELMTNAKVLLLPSVCFENCPLSILEAQAMGVPVVTMNYGGMAELVREGVTGALAEEPTPEGIAAKLRKVMEEETYYKKLSENCKAARDNILSVETYCDRLLKEYERLIQR